MQHEVCNLSVMYMQVLYRLAVARLSGAEETKQAWRMALGLHSTLSTYRLVLSDPFVSIERRQL